MHFWTVKAVMFLLWTKTTLIQFPIFQPKLRPIPKHTKILIIHTFLTKRTSKILITQMIQHTIFNRFNIILESLIPKEISS